MPYRSAADLPSAFAAMRGDAGPLGLRSRKSRGAANDGPRIRTIVFHGDADNIVHPSNAASIVGAAKEGESIECAEARHTASRAHTRTVTRDKTGKVVVEQWLIHGRGHAWSGGSRDGTYTDPRGPDASSEMLQFFLEERHELAGAESNLMRGAMSAIALSRRRYRTQSMSAVGGEADIANSRANVRS